MAPTEGRFARPERRWDCAAVTPYCRLKNFQKSKHNTIRYDTIEFNVDYRKLSIQLYLAHVDRKKN